MQGGKYFFPTAEQGANLAEMFAAKASTADEYSLTSGWVSSDLVDQFVPILNSGEGAGYFVPRGIPAAILKRSNSRSSAMSVVGKAIIELFATEHGGLKAPMPSGTRSLLVSFVDSEEPETFGAVIDDENGEALTPGSAHLWSEVAEVYGSKGAKFNLHYGREVGRGEIVESVT